MSITVVKATPVINWANPADIAGTALSAKQLNATASVPGTFVYTPSATRSSWRGTAQSLSVTFTPTERGELHRDEGGPRSTCSKRRGLTWANPAEIIYGTGPERDAV